MSYDYIIRKDKLYSGTVSVEQIASYITNLDFVRRLSDYVFEYEVSNLSLRAEIYLEYVDENREVLPYSARDEGSLGVINVVRLCVPYAGMYEDDRSNIYKTLVIKIAQSLSWSAYDEQLGENI